MNLEFEWYFKELAAKMNKHLLHTHGVNNINITPARAERILKRLIKNEFHDNGVTMNILLTLFLYFLSDILLCSGCCTRISTGT